MEAEKEYEGFHRHVSERVDPTKGIKTELDRIFRDSDGQPSQEQIELVADYYTEEKGYDSVRTSFNGKEYVKRGDNSYERVEEKSGENVVYNPRTGRYYYKGKTGFKKIVKE